jgi:nicotinamidase/pyrazinamidase
VIVVDVQNDFADPAGSLSVAGGDEIIERINATVAAAREAGSLIVFTQDWHPPSTPHFEKDGGVWPVHCVADSWGAAFHPDLIAEGEIIRKGTGGEDGYSGFSTRDPVTEVRHETGLDRLLEERGIDHLVVVGLATDYCVKETVLDGRRRGYRVTVLADKVAAVNLQPEDGDEALAAMASRGAQIR